MLSVTVVKDGNSAQRHFLINICLREAVLLPSRCLVSWLLESRILNVFSLER